MATVEILPDLMVVESGSKTLSGAASSLLALNDASDVSYVKAAGTLAQNWAATFRFAVPSLPTNAAIKSIAFRIRHSHNTGSSSGHERIAPVSILVGRLSGTKHVYDVFTAGERFDTYSTSTSVQQVTFPSRSKDWNGSHYLGERAQMLSGRRLYGTVGVQRSSASNSARLYSLSLVITYDEKPVVTLNQPSGAEVVARPPFDWEFSDPEGAPQEVFDARIYTQAMANNAMFDTEDTDMWPPLYHQVVYGPGIHHDLVSGFGENGGAYRSFLRARTAYIWTPGINYVNPATGAFFAPLSDWDTSDFTIAIAAPRAPKVTAVYDSVSHGILVTVQGLDNMMEYNDSSFETDVSGYVGGTNTTLASDATQFLHGNKSMKMTRNTSTGDATAISPLVPALEGNTYTAMAWFRANTTSRTCVVTLLFWNDLGGLVGAASNFHSLTDVNTGWRQSSTWGTAPAGTTQMSVQVAAIGAAATEAHFVDQVGIFPGTFTQLLTENQADLESGTTGWAAGTSSSIAQDTTQAYRNKASLKVTRNTTTGTGSATTPTGTSGVPVLASTQYTASARFRANTAGRTVQISIAWYTAAGALISTSTGTGVADVTTGWTQATVTATSPGTAAFATVIVEILSAIATEFHFVDGIVLNPGATPAEIPTWDQGGFVHDTAEEHQIELQRYLTLDDMGNPIWEVIPEPRVDHQPRHQTLTYADYEVPALDSANYRAKIEAEDFAGDMQNSPWSSIATATMAAFDSWWLRDPLDPGEMSMRIRVVEATLTTPKPNSVDFPVGANAAVMTHDGSKTDAIRVTVDLLNEEDYEMFRALVDSGNTLLLQDVIGHQWYVQVDDGNQYDYLRAVKTPSEPWPVRHAHRSSVNFIGVEKPRSLGMTAGHSH